MEKLHSLSYIPNTQTHSQIYKYKHTNTSKTNQFNDIYKIDREKGGGVIRIRYVMIRQHIANKANIIIEKKRKAYLFVEESFLVLTF